MNKVHDGGGIGADNVIIVKEAAAAAAGFQRLVELNPRNLNVGEREEEEGLLLDRGRRRPLHPPPSEVGRIFELVENERRNSSRTGEHDIQIMQLDDDTRCELGKECSFLIIAS